MLQHMCNRLAVSHCGGDRFIWLHIHDDKFVCTLHQLMLVHSYVSLAVQLYSAGVLLVLYAAAVRVRTTAHICCFALTST